MTLGATGLPFSIRTLTPTLILPAKRASTWIKEPKLRQRAGLSLYETFITATRFLLLMAASGGVPFRVRIVQRAMARRPGQSGAHLTSQFGYMHGLAAPLTLGQARRYRRRRSTTAGVASRVSGHRNKSACLQNSALSMSCNERPHASDSM